MERERADRCPGVLRPWIADDGALVRLRLVGGALSTQQLADLLLVSGRFGDGDVHLTRRANLQVRGVPHTGGEADPAFVEAVVATGLLPSRSHELVRNIMVSPLTGRLGGRADLRPVAASLDALVCADPDLADLSARFLFVLDDGRGDVAGRPLDLGAMAVDATHAQLRVGEHWGEVVALDDVPQALVGLAHRFRHLRGPVDTDALEGSSAPWHVAELDDAGVAMLDLHHARDLRTQVKALPLPVGPLAQDDGRTALHVDVPDGLLTHDLATRVLAEAGRDVVVTPWRTLVLPDLETA
ncbi:nitrite reductase [Aeromicrobium halocynthiae]|uniref:nitrite reductase n=1 Tax=Aeromicrobium halocynthiae TaxID=560557 RepID=UPI0031DC4735